MPQTFRAWLSGIALAPLIYVPVIHASPQGGEIVAGQGSINQSGSLTAIQQDSQRLAIDWQTFNVAVDERVQFNQPNQDAVALNRIFDQNPSQILGRIDANGNVMLVNPRGIIFGRSASINTNSFVASALDIDPDKFIQGEMVFSAVADTEGRILNQGIINAATGGSVTLLGRSVENDGLILATLGRVNLVAGDEAVLTFDADGLMGVQVTKDVLKNQIGVDDAVLNAGQIDVEGGQVVMSAKVSQDLFTNAVNNTGIVSAKSIENRSGGIFLSGAGSDVVNSGELNAGAYDMDVSGGAVELQSTHATLVQGDGKIIANSQFGVGGDVKVLGDRVGLFDSAMIDVSGYSGGGQVLIGGDQQGLNPNIQNASAIYLSQSSYILADALESGDGGTIITYADGAARIYGRLSAKGGVESGNGGFIETSGKQFFEILNTPDVSTYDGTGGTWLIDPFDINIVAGNGIDPSSITTTGGNFDSIAGPSNLGVDLITAALTGGNTVTITTGEDTINPGTGNINLNVVLNYDGIGSGTLVLNAIDTININQDIDDLASGGDILNLQLSAGNINLVGGADIFTQSGNISIAGDTTLFGNADIETNGGSFSATGNLDLSDNSGSSIVTGGGGFSLTNATFSFQNSSQVSTDNPIVGQAEGNYTLDNVTIDTNGGAFTISNANVVSFLNATSITTDGGQVNINNNIGSFNGAASSITTTGSGNSDGGNVSITTTNGELVAGSIVSQGGVATNQNGRTGGTIRLTNSSALNNNISVSGTLDVSGSDGERADTGGNFNSRSRGGGAGGSIQINTSGEVSIANVILGGGDADGTGGQDARSGGNAGSLTFVSATPSKIILTDNISAIGGIGFNGGAQGTSSNINFNATQIELNSASGLVAINTAGSSLGNVTFSGTLDTAQAAAAPIDLAIDSGSANITFNQSVGADTTKQRLGDIDVTTTGDVLFASGLTLNSTSLTANNIDDFTTINTNDTPVNISTGGLVNADGGVVSITGADVVRIGTINTSGGVDSGDGVQNAGSVTLRANQLTFGEIIARGGDASVVNGNGGAGGAVTIEDTNSSIFNLTANIDTGGGAGNGTELVGSGGNISLQDAVNLGNSVTLSTGAGGGDINFSGDINGGNNLTLTAGTGNINIGGDIGNNTRLGALVIASANNVNGAGRDVFAASLTQANGTGSTQFDVIDTNAVGGINIRNNTISVGAVDVSSAGSGNGFIATANGNGTDTINFNGDVDTNGGLVTLSSSGGINVDRSITTNGGAFTVNNSSTFTNDNANGSISTGAGNVGISSTGNIQLGAITTTTGGLTIATTTGTITQNQFDISRNLDIGGDVSFSATNGTNFQNITLNNVGNNFGGTTAFQGNDVSLRQSFSATDFDIETSHANGNLIIDVLRDISQTGALTVNGTTNLTTGNNTIALTNAANDFQGPVTITTTGANAVAITDASALNIGTWNVGSGTITVNANGISQSGAITQSNNGGTATFDAGNGVVTLNGANDFTGVVSLIGLGAGGSTVTDANNITLGATNLAGNLAVSAGEDITVNALITLGTAGNRQTLTLNSGQGSLVTSSTIDLTGASYALNDIVVSGGSSNDILQTDNGNYTWNITNNGTGNIEDITGVEGTLPDLSFTDIERIEAGNGDDFFNVVGNSDIINGVNAGGEVLGDTATLTGGEVIVGQEVSGGSSAIAFEDVENFAGDGLTSTLRAGDNGTHVWTINDENDGVVRVGGTDYRFTNFSILLGNDENDIFRFEGNGRITGSIDGGSGDNTINLSALTSEHNWNISGNNSGGIDLITTDINGNKIDSGVDIVTQFSGIQNVIGGSSIDTFAFSGGARLGSINGGNGNDVIRGGAVNTDWLVNSANGGDAYIEGERAQTNSTALFTFSNVENLVGGIDVDDAFTFTNNATLNSINGGGGTGSDSLIAADNNHEWRLNASGAHQLRNATTNSVISNFSQIENVTGGNGDDRFVFESGATLTGVVDGGGGAGRNHLDFTAYTSALNINITNRSASPLNSGANAAYSNINEITAGSAVDTLTAGTASGVTNTWTVDGVNSGDFSNATTSLAFNGFENLTGGAGTDNFTIESTAIVNGSILGMQGDDRLTVNYAAGRTITFDGGIGNNTLNLQGDAGPLASVYDYDIAFAARVVNTVVNPVNNTVSQSVTVHNSQTIVDTMSANELVINGSTANDSFLLATGTQPGAVNQIRISGFTSVVDFDGKNDMTINSGGGIDSVDVESNFTMNGNVVINANSITSSGGTLAADQLTLNNMNSVGSTSNSMQFQVDRLAINALNGNAYIVELDGLEFLSSNINGDLNLTTQAGNINSTQAISVSGSGTFVGASGSSFLLNGQGNQFQGPVSFAADTGVLSDVSLVNGRDTELAGVQSVTLTLNSTGNITDSAAINVSGLTQITANNTNVVLDEAGNDFGILSATGVDQLQVVDVDELGIESVSANSITLQTGGAVTDQNAGNVNFTANQLSINAQNGIGFGDRLEASVDNINLVNAGSGNIELYNVQALNINSISNNATTNGAISIAATDTITQSGNILTVADSSSVSVISENGAITMLEGMTTKTNAGDIDYHARNSVTVSTLEAREGSARGDVEIISTAGSILSTRPAAAPNVVSHNARFIAPTGSLGSPQHRFVIDATGVVFIDAVTSARQFTTKPENIVDSSRILVGVDEAKAEVGGSQRTEVDALAILDPAIFTEVKNYTQDQYYVRLPDDQLFDEDDEKKKRKEDPDIFDTEKPLEVQQESSAADSVESQKSVENSEESKQAVDQKQDTQ